MLRDENRCPDQTRRTEQMVVGCTGIEPVTNRLKVYCSIACNNPNIAYENLTVKYFVCEILYLWDSLFIKFFVYKLVYEIHGKGSDVVRNFFVRELFAIS